MEKLALLGGPKAAAHNYEADCNLPLVPDKAYRTVNEMLMGGHISSGPVVKQFEERFRAYVGAQYSLCGVNATSLIQECLSAVGVGPGDEVLVPSYTFWATVAPIVAANGVPVFCEIDKDTLQIDPADMQKRITPRTKAILAVHVWGCPCDMDAVMAVAKRHGLKVVEDCSHAHGALYHGRKVGTIGDAGVFSLQGSKTLPAGEGGILVTNTREVYERCVALGHYERLKGLPEDSAYRRYFLTGMGYKHRCHPLGIAIADAHLDVLDERNAMRYENGLRFDRGVADIPFIAAQKQYADTLRCYSYHYYTYNRRQFGGVTRLTVLRALAAEGVVCGDCGYGHLHEAPFFTEGIPTPAGFAPHFPRQAMEPLSLPITEDRALNTFMAVPRFEKPCDEIIDRYIAAYHKVFAQQGELAAYEKAHPVLSEAPTSGRSINLFEG